MGIEPTFEAWEAPVLPLNYTRMRLPFLTIPIQVMGRFRTSLYSTLLAIAAHEYVLRCSKLLPAILSNPRLKPGKLQFTH